jgi:hypothetical protein
MEVYHIAQKSVIFDNTSRLSCGFLPELYERLDNDATLGQVYEVRPFPPSEHLPGIRSVRFPGQDESKRVEEHNRRRSSPGDEGTEGGHL